jgi:hypothetical protein
MNDEAGAASDDAADAAAVEESSDHEGSDHDMHAAPEDVIHELIMNDEGPVPETSDKFTMSADDASQVTNVRYAAVDGMSDSDSTPLYNAEGVLTKYRRPFRNHRGVPPIRLTTCLGVFPKDLRDKCLQQRLETQ